MKRRTRSHMSIEDAHQAFAEFAGKMVRMGETSDAAMFTPGDGSGNGHCSDAHINVMFLVRGSYGVGSDVFEAIRVLAGHKLPRKVAP